MTSRSLVGWCRGVGLVAAWLSAPATATRAFAQPEPLSRAPDSASAKRSCFRGRPLPVCDRYWLTEFGLAAPVLNEGFNHSGGLFTWELGRMKNVAEKHALGAAIFAEVGHLGDGLGLRPR